MTYEIMQVFAKSWGMLFLMGLFIAAIAYAFWPSNKDRFSQAAFIPLDDDEDEVSDNVK